jgi:hypothetical protein
MHQRKGDGHRPVTREEFEKIQATARAKETK